MLDTVKLLRLLPILTAPELVPVFILVPKLLESFRLIVAPEIVAPRFPDSSWAIVNAPALDVSYADVGK